MFIYMFNGNFTTNLAESWMHVRTKFDGGKQINRIQSGAWEGRCAGASIRVNHGPEWGLRVWEEVTMGEANPIIKAVSKEKAQQVEVDRKRKATDNAKSSRRETKYRMTNDHSLQVRKDYDRHDDSPGVPEVDAGIPQAYLRNLTLDYYTANVTVSVAN